ncbi:MAG: alkaline ceramidase [Hydrocarboniphaga sp.]|uniref:neutral/alkaline non-lysosomal ceramidase N-terminal domain-containing protein n=1 Tax=Hydrocarboniphaga sp. TaxID=2033016 RepID=UPI002632888B|nr:neutral/alkaline non-lysosomal ceramidase N-terminal domain-containing protein [Hydrocarboniphaga sp.]MDB5970789.1 alkaline ceramidase [Hydrocarboniphaga sp.]
MRKQTTAVLAAMCAVLAGCGASSPDGSGDAAMCQAGELTAEQMLAVRRDQPDAPLADLSHYQARHAARATGAVLNGGDCADNTRFRYGAGTGDISGPASGEELLGYADPGQVSEGLHTREYARAFAFESDCGGRSGHAMLITVENGLAFDSIKFGVLARIAAHDSLDPSDPLADYWNIDNILISATHTHSSSAGQSHYDLVNLFAFGLDQQAYQSIVDGVFDALLQAHRNMIAAPAASVKIAMAEVLDANFNRSPDAFVLNPADERARFADTQGRDVQTNRWMTLLKLQRDDGTPVGVVDWFSVHGTSIGQTYKLLSSDNKGYAARRFAADFPQGGSSAGAFVAGFFQSDEGDASPNPYMLYLSEAELHSRDTDAWFARGGGRDDFESAQIAGYKQYHGAKALWDQADEKLHGEVRAVHLALDMSRVVVEAPKTYAAGLMPAVGTQRTCEPALGISFAAGAEDGRGPFTEGAACPVSTDTADYIAQYLQDTIGPLFDGAIPSTLIEPIGCYNPAFAALGYACQQEKPIAIPLVVAPLGLPVLELQPYVIPIQIIALGNLAIVSVPWETTTVAGRRLREAVLDQLQDAGIDYAVISGLSNTYIHYLTTREEYAQQDYEGASTVFGPWSQDAVVQEYVRLAGHLRDGSAAASPYAAASFTDHTPILRHLPSVSDGTLPAGVAFGDVAVQPQTSYTLSSTERTTISASFYAGNPRRDLRRGSSYVYIERQNGEAWDTIASDDDWSTYFTYQKGADGRANLALVEWKVPAGTRPGTYRIRIEGASADGPYSGASQPFQIAGCG